MLRATELAHLLIRRAVKPGDRVVDATAGNGHDTLLLAELVGPQGRVFGFDVQQAALEATAERVEGLVQVTLVHAGHETLGEYLAAHGDKRLAAVMFNLGYLPGAPKDIITREPTTLAALEQALDHLEIHGLVTLVLYPGHAGGDEEAAAVRSYAHGLPGTYAANRYARFNTSEPAPELLVIERLSA
jgi:hypothetical protein